MKTLFTIASLMLAFVLHVAVAGTAVQLKPDHPQEYTVVKGDTLWGIADRFLEEPWRWPEIWKGNPQIEDPNLIYPGDVISLSWENGQPVLSVAGTEAESEPMSREEKWSPEIAITRSGQRPIPAIPLRAVQTFFSQTKIVDKEEHNARPHVFSSLNDFRHTVSGDKLYIRGLEGTGAAVGDKFTSFRLGKPYVSKRLPDQELGYAARKTGEMLIVEMGEPAIAIVTSSSIGIREGDRLYPPSSSEIEKLVRIVPRSPGGEVMGSIIDFASEMMSASLYNVVVLDLGSEHGIETGNLLAVYQWLGVRADSALADQHLSRGGIPLDDEYAINAGYKLAVPDEKSAVLLVFKVHEKISYAVVMKAFREVALNDMVASM